MSAQLNCKEAAKRLSNMWLLYAKKEIPHEGLIDKDGWVVIHDRVIQQVALGENVACTDLETLESIVNELPNKK